jgi:DnaJ-class molecular chaperone
MTQPQNPGDEVPPGTDQSAENVCPDCNGSGKLSGAECPACGGTGKVITLVGDA